MLMELVLQIFKIDKRDWEFVKMLKMEKQFYLYIFF